MGSLFGFDIDSELPLTRLRSADGPRGRIVVARAGPGILDEPAEITSIDSLETASGQHVFVVGNAGDRHMIGCSATGSYRFSNHEMRVETAPEGTPEMWEHRLLSVIIPIMLAGRGDLVLHACAVEIARKAVLFCGPPMRGKSTLALTFSELGHRVLSEDGAVFERLADGWVVWPAATGARIRVESDHGVVAKVVTHLSSPEAGPLPPGAVVLLEPRGGTGVPVPADRATSLVDLTTHLLHRGAVDAFRPAFGLLAELLADVPVMRVSVPDDLLGLPAAAANLAACLGELEPAAIPE